ncbi:hypothetical protein B0T10DRAFT_450993, partial [Thelonectria olida]
MTTEKCISLVGERRYVGIFRRSCYVADTLDAAALVPDAQCDIPCPGDATLFCGGLVLSAAQRRNEASIHRRDAPSDIVLTLYSRVVDGTESPSDAASIPTSASFGGVSFSLSSTAAGTREATVVDVPSESIPFSVAAPSDNISLSVADGPSRISETAQGSDRTYGLTWTMTETEPVTTVAMVLYTTVDLANPSRLTVTKLHVTLTYFPCHSCPNHGVPLVEMTTVTARCSACGQNGRSDVVLTVPNTACSACAMGPVDSATVDQQSRESKVQQQSLPGAAVRNKETSPTWLGARPEGHRAHEILSVPATHQLPASAPTQLPGDLAQQLPDSPFQRPSAPNANQVPASVLHQLSIGNTRQSSASALDQPSASALD